MFKHLKTQQISGVPIKVWFSNQILSLKDIISIKIVGFPNLFCRISTKMKSVEFSGKLESLSFIAVSIKSQTTFTRLLKASQSSILEKSQYSLLCGCNVSIF
jgi:hypothetical protein